MDIIVDSDGFFWPPDIESTYMRKQRKLISFENEEEKLNDLFEQYYLGFRSAMFICEDTIKNESEAEKALLEYREGCIHSAMAYMKNHIESGSPLPVDFMWIVREAIVNGLKKEFPNVKNIKLRLSMKPRLSARTVDQDTIVFPALTRTILIHCNLVIINSIYDVTNEDGRLAGDIDFKQNAQNARFIFPYLLYCHDEFSVRNLPMIGTRSQSTIKTALQFTNLQLIFIFAHEYAHILLKHFDDSKENFIKENEADSFALKAVLAYVEKDSSYSKHDVLASIRWLFKYQLIEEKIGELAQGKAIKDFESNFEDRRGKFQSELFSNSGLNGSTLFESIGFCMIVELQSILYEMGLDLINNIIEIFHKSEKTGGIEPWWEKITQN